MCLMNDLFTYFQIIHLQKLFLVINLIKLINNKYIFSFLTHILEHIFLTTDQFLLRF